MIDCIGGYHLNPWTCGIAKFNTILAQYLGVPVVGIRAVELGSYTRPLLSIKLSEFSAADHDEVVVCCNSHEGRVVVIVHAFDG